MRTSVGFGLLVMVAACGDDGPGGTTVTIDVRGASLIAARQVEGAWTVLTPDAAGVATYPVDRTFEVVAVCTEEVKVLAWRAAPADVTGDPAQFAARCGFVPDAFVNVTNALDREVWVTGRSGSAVISSALAPGATQLFTVAPGVGDLVVEDRAAGTAGVLRGVTFTDGGTVTVRDVALAPMTSRPFSPPPPAGANVSSRFMTTAVAARFEVSGGAALTVGPAATRPGDRHLLVYEQARPVDERRRILDLDPASSAPVVLTPPPFMTSATLTGEPLLSATYQASGEWPRRTLLAAPIRGASWRVVLDAGAGDVSGTAIAPDPSAIPGWDPAWDLTGGGPGNWDLTLVLERTDATGRDELRWTAHWPRP